MNGLAEFNCIVICVCGFWADSIGSDFGRGGKRDNRFGVRHFGGFQGLVLPQLVCMFVNGDFQLFMCDAARHFGEICTALANDQRCLVQSVKGVWLLNFWPGRGFISPIA